METRVLGVRISARDHSVGHLSPKAHNEETVGLEQSRVILLVR